MIDPNISAAAAAIAGNQILAQGLSQLRNRDTNQELDAYGNPIIKPATTDTSAGMASPAQALQHARLKLMGAANPEQATRSGGGGI